MITATDVVRAKSLMANMINAYLFNHLGKKNTFCQVKSDDISEDKNALEETAQRDCVEFVYKDWRCYVTDKPGVLDGMEKYLSMEKMQIEYHGVVEGLAYIMTLMKK